MNNYDMPTMPTQTDQWLEPGLQSRPDDLDDTITAFNAGKEQPEAVQPDEIEGVDVTPILQDVLKDAQGGDGGSVDRDLGTVAQGGDLAELRDRLAPEAVSAEDRAEQLYREELTKLYGEKQQNLAPKRVRDMARASANERLVNEQRVDTLRARNEEANESFDRKATPGQMAATRAGLEGLGESTETETLEGAELKEVVPPEVQTAKRGYAPEYASEVEGPKATLADITGELVERDFAKSEPALDQLGRAQAELARRNVEETWTGADEDLPAAMDRAAARAMDNVRRQLKGDSEARFQYDDTPEGRNDFVEKNREAILRVLSDNVLIDALAPEELRPDEIQQLKNEENAKLDVVVDPQTGSTTRTRMRGIMERRGVPSVQIDTEMDQFVEDNVQKQLNDVAENRLAEEARILGELANTGEMSWNEKMVVGAQEDFDNRVNQAIREQTGKDPRFVDPALRQRIADSVGEQIGAELLGLSPVMEADEVREDAEALARAREDFEAQVDEAVREQTGMDPRFVDPALRERIAVSVGERIGAELLQLSPVTEADEFPSVETEAAVEAGEFEAIGMAVLVHKLIGRKMDEIAPAFKGMSEGDRASAEGALLGSLEKQYAFDATLEGPQALRARYEFIQAHKVDILEVFADEGTLDLMSSNYDNEAAARVFVENWLDQEISEERQGAVVFATHRERWMDAADTQARKQLGIPVRIEHAGDAQAELDTLRDEIFETRVQSAIDREMMASLTPENQQMNSMMAEFALLLMVRTGEVNTEINHELFQMESLEQFKALSPDDFFLLEEFRRQVLVQGLTPEAARDKVLDDEGELDRYLESNWIKQGMSKTAKPTSGKDGWAGFMAAEKAAGAKPLGVRRETVATTGEAETGPKKLGELMTQEARAAFEARVREGLGDTEVPASTSETAALVEVEENAREGNAVAKTILKLWGPEAPKVHRAVMTLTGGAIGHLLFGNAEGGAAAGNLAARGLRPGNNFIQRLKAGRGIGGAVKGFFKDSFEPRKLVEGLKSNVKNTLDNVAHAWNGFWNKEDYEKAAPGDSSWQKAGAGARFIANRVIIATGFALGIPYGIAVDTLTNISTPFLKPLEGMISLELATLWPRMWVGLAELGMKKDEKLAKQGAKDKKIWGKVAKLGEQEGYKRFDVLKKTAEAIAGGAAIGAVSSRILGLGKKIRDSKEAQIEDAIAQDETTEGYVDPREEEMREQQRRREDLKQRGEGGEYEDPRVEEMKEQAERQRRLLVGEGQDLPTPEFEWGDMPRTGEVDVTMADGVPVPFGYEVTDNGMLRVAVQSASGTNYGITSPLQALQTVIAKATGGDAETLANLRQQVDRLGVQINAAQQGGVGITPELLREVFTEEMADLGALAQANDFPTVQAFVDALNSNNVAAFKDGFMEVPPSAINNLMGANN